MSVTVTPTLEDVFTQLRAFLLLIVPAGTTGEVIRGQVNQVPQPLGLHVVMTLLRQARLQTNIREYFDPFPSPGGTQETQNSIQLDVQLDFYGEQSGLWAAAASTYLRDELGCSSLGPASQPLHADEAVQMPLITGEDNYLERWMVVAYLHWTPVATLGQQFADTLEIDLVNVDERYPP